MYDRDDAGKLSAQLLPKIQRILTALDVATKPADLNLPAYRLHPLKGDYAGYYSVSVSGNWRIVFRFDGEAPTDVDLVDYH